MDYVSGTVSLIHECQRYSAIIHSSQPCEIARYLPGNNDIYFLLYISWQVSTSF